MKQKMKWGILLVMISLAMGTSMVHAEEEDPTIVEGYTVEEEGYMSVVTWCKNEQEDRNIYGKFYYPEDFDSEKTYPTVIMSHGLNSQAAIVERSQWPKAVTEQGYVAYAFDFCGGSVNSKSDMDFLEMSILTEVSDLNAVMDFVKEQSFVDTDHLFLLGQSQGGLVSALTGAARSEEVRGMILVYPALCLIQDLHDYIPDISEVTGDTVETRLGTLGAVYALDAYDIDVMEEIGAYEGDVLIIHGIEDKTIPYSWSMDAITTAYAESASELVLITGKQSTHGFEMIYEEGREYALQTGVDFLNLHLEDSES